MISGKVFCCASLGNSARAQVSHFHQLQKHYLLPTPPPPPQLYTSLCLKKKKEDKTYQTPTHLLVRSKRKNSPGPAESWLSLFMYVTATNAKAHCILLNANPISKKGGLKTNQNWVISPKSDQKNNFQSICLRACLYHSLYVLIKMPF